MLHTFLMIIHFFCAAAIVALVLLQRGKGAEAGAGFGAGASGTVFGARGASTALSRATAVLAAIFMVTSLSLAYVGARRGSAPANSLLDLGKRPCIDEEQGGPGGAISGGADAAGAAAATTTPAIGAETGGSGSAPAVGTPGAAAPATAAPASPAPAGQK